MAKASTTTTTKAPPKKAPAKSAPPKKAPAKSAGNKPQPEQDTALLDFFTDELKDIYWAEKHLVKTLPKMKKAATSASLADAFAEHLEVTKTHVSRLEQVFELMDKKAQAKKCDAMEGIVKEGISIIEETEAGTATRDVGLILAGQKVEHYEIATYGGLAQLAKTLGLTEVNQILAQTLAEEKEADQALSSIAEQQVNMESAAE